MIDEGGSMYQSDPLPSRALGINQDILTCSHTYYLYIPMRRKKEGGRKKNVF